MKRAAKVTLQFVTSSKRQKIAALLEAYRAAVNFYIRSLWENPGKLDKATLARLKQTRLSERYKSQALKQAIEIVIATKKSAKELDIPATCPIFKGAAVLDAKFVTIEEGQGSFDLAIKLSVLRKGERLTIPTKRTAVLNKWLDEPSAQLIEGCALSENSLILWVEFPEAEVKLEGEVLAVDLGVNKLLSDSKGNHYGKEFKKVRDKIKRRKPGSKGRARAFRERENLINRTINQLPWGAIKTIGVEALHDMKRGKKKGRGKTFRKAMAPWTYRRVLNRIGEKAQENRVRLVRVDPANTSRTCPECGAAHKENRNGEKFLCIICGRAGDADTVGAQIILARTLATLGSVESPRLNKAM
ncbi:MAG: transposase [Acidobacteria bacterium]|nr:transposase [Acidobacteriota bacterium]